MAGESDKGKFDSGRGSGERSVPKRLLLKQCQQAVEERDKTDPGKVNDRVLHKNQPYIILTMCIYLLHFLCT